MQQIMVCAFLLMGLKFLVFIALVTLSNLPYIVVCIVHVLLVMRSAGYNNRMIVLCFTFIGCYVCCSMAVQVMMNLNAVVAKCNCLIIWGK